MRLRNSFLHPTAQSQGNSQCHHSAATPEPAMSETNGNDCLSSLGKQISEGNKKLKRMDQWRVAQMILPLIRRLRRLLPSGSQGVGAVSGGEKRLVTGTKNRPSVTRDR